jgi:allantoate deiminase
MTGLRDQSQLAQRTTDLLQRLAAISEDGAGVTRVGYSRLERQAHSLFTEEMNALGLHVHVDPAGNTIAELTGQNPSLGAIGTGSHLDSVPGGGRFDGITGVVSAVVAAELIVSSGRVHDHPLRFVAFACEEGARFGQACVGSRFAAGLMRPRDADNLRDRGGTSLAEAMAGVGLDAVQACRQPWRPADWAGFVELHVEQGGVLERMDTTIGVVDLISGSTRVRLHLTGRASHSGATPMSDRADALTAASRIVLLAEALATDSRHRGTRITVGRLEVIPGSITTIPGEIEMTVDIRDVDSDRQRNTAAELIRRAGDICMRRGIAMEADLLGDTSPVVLPVRIRYHLEAAARDLGLKYRTLVSGASHDAQQMSHQMPTGMIFVPSCAALSHVPDEWTDPADIVTGTRVLVESLHRLDEALP